MVAKQTKSAKNYKRNKKLISSNIKSRKVLQQRNRDESIKNKKLLEEEMPDTEQQEQMQEQRYLNRSSKASSTTGATQKGSISSADVTAFLKSLKDNTSDEGDMDDEDIQKMINDMSDEDSDDPEILDMTGTTSSKMSSNDSDDDEEEEEEKAPIKKLTKKQQQQQQESDSEDEDENTEENENENDASQSGAGDDSDDEDFETILKRQEEEDEEKSANIDPSKKIITRELISSWIYQISTEDRALHGAKQLILGFLSAVSKTDGSTSGEDEVMTVPYQIINNNIYQRVVIAATHYVSKVMNKILNIKDGSVQVPKRSSKAWKKVHTSIVIYLKGLCMMFETLTDEKLLEYALKDLLASIHLFANFPKKVTRLFHCLLNLLSHEKETIRFSAFLNIHKMATLYPYPFVSTCIKGVYFTMIEKSSQFRAYNHVPIEFMKNCVVELCGIDLSVSYKYAFMSLRELAIQLRGAYDSKPHAYLKCYNWTFLNSVHVWVKVLCAYQKQDELRDLIYPLVQIITGCITANTTYKYFNARLKCLSMMNELMQTITAPRLYIPLLPHIFGIFNSEIGVKSNKKYHTGDALDVDFKLRMRTSQAVTVEYQRHVLETALYYMIEFFALNSRSIAFPELSYPAERFLNNWANTSRVETSFKKKVKLLVTEMKKNADLVMDKRSKVSFSPLDTAQSQNFMNKEDHPQVTPLEKLFAFEKKIRDSEIVERIQARLGKGVDLDAENESDDESDDENMTAAEKEEMANPLPEDEVEKVSTKRKRDKKVKKEPQAKKVKISKKTAQKGGDVVQELDLDDF